MKLYHDVLQRVEKEENNILIKALEFVKEEAVEEDAMEEDTGGEDVEEKEAEEKEAGGENGAIDDVFQTPGESNVLFSPSPPLNIEDSNPELSSPSLHYPEDFTLDPEWMMMMLNEEHGAGYDGDIST